MSEHVHQTINKLDHCVHCGKPMSELSDDKGPRSAMTGFCHVRMFKPQFAQLVLSGEKCQTVRPTPKRMPKPGDRISLREWKGKPYRSKQRILRTSEITAVATVEIHHDRFVIGGQVPTPTSEWEFAKADGFNTPKDMLDWFAFEHGLPFKGIVIKWQNERGQL